MSGLKKGRFCLQTLLVICLSIVVAFSSSDTGLASPITDSSTNCEVIEVQGCILYGDVGILSDKDKLALLCSILDLGQ